MTQSRLTLNLKCHKVDDWGKTREFLRDLDPVEVVAAIDNINDFNRILEIQHDLPNAKVHARPIIKVNGVEYDGAMHLTPLAPGDNRRYLISPGDFLNSFGVMGKGGLSLYTLNEPSGEVDQQTIAQLVQWLIECINLANQRDIALTVLNWSVGHPRLINGESEWDARFDDILVLLSRYPQHTLGMHLYSPADLFGRLDAMLARCKKINGGIKPPRVAITEFGWDTHNGDQRNGYKSRGLTGEQYAAWQGDIVRNVYGSYIRAGVLQSVATFIWGDEASWSAFNVENDQGWRDAILTAKREGKLTIESRASVVRPTVPAPANKGTATDITVAGSSSWNLRTTPEIDGAKVGLIVPGETLKLYMTTTQPNGGKNWYFVERANAPAAESVSGWIAYVLPVVQPDPPVVVDPPPVGLPPAFLEVSAEYAMKMHLSTLKIAENVRKEAAGILASNASIDAEIDLLKARKQSNILRAQDLESGAQMYTEIADNWKWIAEQTSPPVAA